MVLCERVDGTATTFLVSLAGLFNHRQSSTTPDVQLRMLADHCWLPIGEWLTAEATGALLLTEECALCMLLVKEAYKLSFIVMTVAGELR